MRSPSARTPSVETSVEAPLSRSRAPTISATSDASGDRLRGREQPAPAVDDVGRGQRRPVAEREPLAKRERHLATVVGHRPRLGEGGADGERGVDGGERLVQLAHERGAAEVAVTRGVDRGRRARDDGDGARVGGRDGIGARPTRGGPQADRHRDDDQQGHHAHDEAPTPRRGCDGARLDVPRARRGHAGDRGRLGRRRWLGGRRRGGGRRRPDRRHPRRAASGRPPPGLLRQRGIGSAGIEEPFDRDRETGPRRPRVARAGEPGQQSHDTDPATHRGSIRAGRRKPPRARLATRGRRLRAATSRVAGQEMRPRRATPPGERCYLRGLCHGNDRSGVSLWHGSGNLRGTTRDRSGAASRRRMSR